MRPPQDAGCGVLALRARAARATVRTGDARTLAVEQTSTPRAEQHARRGLAVRRGALPATPVAISVAPSGHDNASSGVARMDATTSDTSDGVVPAGRLAQ